MCTLANSEDPDECDISSWSTVCFKKSDLQGKYAILFENYKLLPLDIVVVVVSGIQPMKAQLL